MQIGVLDTNRLIFTLAYLMHSKSRIFLDYLFEK
jgi:hypothetical protein